MRIDIVSYETISILKLRIKNFLSIQVNLDKRYL